MEYTTGLPTAKFADLLIRLREEGVEDHPPSLGLRDSLRAALIYMRHKHFAGGDRRAAGCVPAHDLAGHQGHDRCDRPGPEGRAAHGRGGAPGVRLRGGRRSLPLLELAQSPRIVVGKAQGDRHERPDPGPARRAPGVGLRPLPGVHARRGRPRRLPGCWRESIPPGGSPTRERNSAKDPRRRGFARGSASAGRQRSPALLRRASSQRRDTGRWR